MADYTDLDAVKADLGMALTPGDDDDAITAAITAASREVDGYTGTQFGVSGDPTTRMFDASPDGTVAVDRFTDTAGLEIKTGSGGVYGTTLTAADYVLRPLGAVGNGLAYDTIVVPRIPTYYGDPWPGVSVTARWGFHTVPAPVEFATRLRAVHLYHRRESPHGGNPGYADDGLGGITARRATIDRDSDVVALLAPYTDPGIA